MQTKGGNGGGRGSNCELVGGGGGRFLSVKDTNVGNPTGWGGGGWAGWPVSCHIHTVHTGRS